MTRTHLARLVSIFFDSSILSLFIFPAIGWYVAGWAGVGWALLALFILTGFPLAYILLGMRRGWVSDWELSRREERPRFILVSFSSDLLALFFLWQAGAPYMIWTFDRRSKLSQNRHTFVKRPLHPSAKLITVKETQITVFISLRPQRNEQERIS